MTTRPSASRVLQDEVKRGSHVAEPKAPPICGGEAPALGQECFTGADILVQTLADTGVDTCFTNPGTSEMHMVAALDRSPMRSILGLFEGVVTGAADGYARFAGKPAMTVLHLGPGLANGLANLHNARKARTPIINVVGEHALPHLRHEAPLSSDIEGFARPVSGWTQRVESTAAVAPAARAAAAAANTGCVATLILPADVSWSAASARDCELGAGTVAKPARRDEPPQASVDAAIDALRRDPSASLLLLGGNALLEDGCHWAGAIRQATGCRVATQSLSARMTRGGDRPDLPRVPFDIDAALHFLADVRTLVLIGAPPPIAFFAYPDRPSLLAPEACRVIDAAEDADPLATLRQLGRAVGTQPLRLQTQPGMPAPHGGLNAESIAAAIAATLPDNAIVVDESITAGRHIYASTGRAPRHDWVNNMGGAIGYAMPVAIGAAIACPDRRVLAMVGDGSAFYTDQALWTMARENLDIVVLILANREYAVLRNEWQRVGASTRDGTLSGKARGMLSLDRPAPDWRAIARGHGVDAVRVTDAAALATAMSRAYAQGGPMLIEAWI